MACDDEVIPLQERIETVGDDADLQESMHRTPLALRRLYAGTRLSTYYSVNPASEFLDDLRS